MEIFVYFFQFTFPWHYPPPVILISACGRRNVGFAIMLRGKFLASSGVHNYISTVTDTFHDRFIQTRITDIGLSIGGHSGYFFFNLDAGYRFSGDWRRIFRRRQWAQFAWITGAQAPTAL